MTELRRDPAEGVLESVGERWRLRFVRWLPHPPAKVWRALTEEEHLAAWFPTTIEGDRRPGARLEFRFRGEDSPPSLGEMIAYDPPRLLEFTWGASADGASPPEWVRIELEPDGDGCHLTFTTTYDEVGKSARDAAGWHVCLDLLAARLAGEAPSADAHAAWAPLNRLYAERFGPDAATIGPPTG
ncbi:MAG TPA: SRPBCC family protein [Longimicrobiales bacterium]